MYLYAISNLCSATSPLSSCPDKQEEIQFLQFLYHSSNLKDIQKMVYWVKVMVHLAHER